jgi:dipeptidyl aminopeptidase/acylaminoacyl peptidase
MFQEKISFKNSLDLKLSGVLEGENKESPLVIICHGFDSLKDSPSNARLAQRLVEKGFLVFRFDFTGNGESDGKLSDLTPLQGLDDLKAAVSILAAGDFGLYGSSFGGNVALLYAIGHSVNALALCAAVFDTDGRRKKWLGEAKDMGIYEEAGKIKSPVLIIHGDEDDKVPADQSRRLYESLKSEKELKILNGVPHQFRGKDLEESTRLIVDFFAKYLFDNKTS